MADKKYPNFKYIIETTEGIYPVTTWGFVTQRETLEEAVAEVKNWGELYRVVDSEGKVLFPKEGE